MFCTKKKENKNIESFRSVFSKKQVLEFDKDVLLFALEESRLYLGKLSENTNRLINKGFILLGITGGLIGFIFSNCLWWINFIQTLESTKQINITIEKMWSAILLIVICACFLLRGFYILSKILLVSMSNPPLGATPKNLLREKVMNCNLNELIHNQIENYQDRIYKYIKRNNQISLEINESAKFVIMYPIITIVVFSIIYLLSQYLPNFLRFL